MAPGSSFDSESQSSSQAKSDNKPPKLNGELTQTLIKLWRNKVSSWIHDIASSYAQFQNEEKQHKLYQLLPLSLYKALPSNVQQTIETIK